MPTAYTIAITGHPTWGSVLTPPSGYQLTHYPTAERFVARLTDDGAVLLIVDGAHPDWSTFTAAPKSSPATRRLTVILVAADAAVREASLAQGANLALTPDTVIADFAALVTQHARVLAADEAAQLESECAGTLPPLAVQGIEKFNNREFYPQHDLFEEQWMKTDGPVRNLYRAILQVGVAYYQVERGNYRGARKMLLRAVPWLQMLPDTCQGVDVAQLRQDAYRVHGLVEDPPVVGVGKQPAGALLGGEGRVGRQVAVGGAVAGAQGGEPLGGTGPHARGVQGEDGVEGLPAEGAVHGLVAEDPGEHGLDRRVGGAGSHGGEERDGEGLAQAERAQEVLEEVGQRAVGVGRGLEARDVEPEGDVLVAQRDAGLVGEGRVVELVADDAPGGGQQVAVEAADDPQVQHPGGDGGRGVLGGHPVSPFLSGAGRGHAAL